MNLADFDYNLPKELIAQCPIKPRDASRLLIIDKNTANIAHKNFKDILAYLTEGDILVLNNTKVIPVRLIGYLNNREIELLLLRPIKHNTYEALIKPAKKVKPGDIISLDHNSITAQLTDIVNPQDFSIKTLVFKGIDNIETMLERLGTMPLPPYIKRLPNKEDNVDYQTVYADNPGAVAAPTAGLHFTKELLQAIKNKGVNIAYITLHVGYGTFKQVKAADVTSHFMHKEYFEITPEAAQSINTTKKAGKKIIVAGTTVVRTLESQAKKSIDNTYSIEPGKGVTDIFIYPPYNFKIVDKMLTNFHLPRTTLLMLVSAFCGQELLMQAYKQAIENKYRFYSYGDAMLIL